MTLVDTSVWIDHLRHGDRGLAALLSKGTVLSHPFVIGELACGNLRNREEILSLLSALPSAVVASRSEALDLVAVRKIYGTGLGWIDAHLLASALLSKCAFRTRDRRLRSAARGLGIAA